MTVTVSVGDGRGQQSGMGSACVNARDEPPVVVDVQAYRRPAESVDVSTIVTCCYKQVTLVKLLVGVGVPDDVVHLNPVVVIDVDVALLCALEYVHVQENLRVHHREMTY